MQRQSDSPSSKDVVKRARDQLAYYNHAYRDAVEPLIEEIERLRAALENIRDGIGLEAMSALSLTDARAIARMALSGDSSAHETTENVAVVRCYVCQSVGDNIASDCREVYLEDDGHKTVYVGPTCFKKIERAGDAGLVSGKGRGPRVFFTFDQAARHALRSAVEPICLHQRAEGERGYFGPHCSKCGADLPEKASGELCEGCPPIGYPTDKTRCAPCPRRGVSEEPKHG